jgi:hypothetical protein
MKQLRSLAPPSKPARQAANFYFTILLIAYYIHSAEQRTFHFGYPVAPASHPSHDQWIQEIEGSSKGCPASFIVIIDIIRLPISNYSTSFHSLKAPHFYSIYETPALHGTSLVPQSNF